MLTSHLARKTLLLLSMGITLLGCGGGGGGNPPAALLKGYYKDAGVVGLQYKCGDKSGVTQTDGEFLFRAGQSCTFYLDDAEQVAIREVPSASLNKDGVIIYEDNPIIGQILQSLDSDGDTSDGQITVDPELIGAILNEGIDAFPDNATDAQVVLDIIDANNGATGVVTEEEAQEHMLTTLISNSKFYQHCSGRTEDKAIEEFDFSGLSHPITGDTVTIDSIIFTRTGDNLVSSDGTLYSERSAAESADAGTCALGDTTAPVITLNGDPSTTIAYATSFTDEGATTDDGSSVTVNGTVGTDLGEYTLTYNAVDDAGNIAAPVTRTVTIADQAAPTITLVGDENITVAHGSTYTDEGATAVDDVDGTSTITTQDTVDTNTLGIYTLTYNATDAAGNAAAEVTRFVEVTDQTSPVITLIGDSTITVAQGGTYSDAGANVSDAIDGTSTIITTDTVDTSTVGTYTLKYNATDAAGNVATEVTRTVNVTDQTAPVITLLGSSTINVQVGDSFTDPGATVTDNIDADVTITSPVIVNTTAEGSYTLTYNATDSSGNVATQVTRTVNVSLAPPVLAFSNPWTVYDFNKDINYNNGQPEETYQAIKFEIGTNSKFNFTTYHFIQGSFSPQTTNNSSSEYLLDTSGNWVTDTTDINADVTFNVDNTIATINNLHQIKLLSVEDIAGQTIDLFHTPSLATLMPTAAEKIVMEHTVIRDQYKIYEPAQDYSTGTPITYTVLTDVLTAYCGNNRSFNSVQNPNIVRVSFTCGQENQTSGTLIGYTSNNTSVANVGTWELITLPNSSVQAITTKLTGIYQDSNDARNTFFTKKNGDVWEGNLMRTTDREEQILYNQVVFDAVEAKLAALNSDSGSDNFQVVNGELVMKSVADAPFDPATGANIKTPKNVFGIIGTPQNPINSEVQAFEGDVTFVSAQTGVSATTQARGRIGMYVHLENMAGDAYYVVMTIEQRDGNPLQTRVWKDAYNPTTGLWGSGGTAVTALHNKPITAGTAYHFKFEKLATAGRFSIDNYTVDIPLSELPANDMKLTHLRFFNQVKYPAASNDYIEGKIDNVTVTVRTDPTTGATQAITQNFDSYVDGTIPKPDAVINEIHEGSTTTSPASSFSGDYSILATSTATYTGAAGQIFNCNGASGYFTVDSNGTIAGQVLSVYNTPFNVTGSTAVDGIISNGSFAMSGTTVVNYDGSFSGQTASGTWTATDGTGCTGNWTAKQDTLTTSITASYLTANPWYVVDVGGNCHAKFTYDSNGADLALGYIDQNGATLSESATYSLGTDSTISLVTNVVGNVTNTYFSSTLNSFTYSSSDAYENSAQIAFKNYQDALSYADANGNNICDQYIPE